MSHGMYSSVLSKISNFLMYSIQEPHDIWYKMILRLHPYDMQKDTTSHTKIPALT